MECSLFKPPRYLQHAPKNEPSMEGVVCNQLLTKFHVELEYNSNVFARNHTFVQELIAAKLIFDHLPTGVQATYWSMLEEGRITQTAALILMQSVDEALDKVYFHWTSG